MRRLIEPMRLSLWALLSLSGAAVSGELFAFSLYALLLALYTANLGESRTLTVIRNIAPALLALIMGAAQEQLLQETGPLEWGNLGLTFIIGTFFTRWLGVRQPCWSNLKKDLSGPEPQLALRTFLCSNQRPSRLRQTRVRRRLRLFTTLERWKFSIW